MENYLNSFNPSITYTPYIVQQNPIKLETPEFKFDTYKPEYKLKDLKGEVIEPVKKPADVPVPLSPSMEGKISLSDLGSVNYDNLNYIGEKLRKAGIKNNQLAAILATVIAESGANPKAKGDAGKAKGLWQWHPDRYKAGEDLDSQVQLMLDELSNVKSGGWLGRQNYMDAFNGDDLWTSVDTLTRRFIRPADGHGQARKRYEIAQKILKQLNG